MVTDKIATAAAPKLSHEFMIDVSTVDGPHQAFAFDRDRVVVGRADDADLRVAHSAMARHQLAIERISFDATPRFRIVLLGGRNATYLNGQPAVEGSILPGEELAVGPVRLVIQTPKKKPEGGKGVKLELRQKLIFGVCGIGTLLMLFTMMGGGAAAAPVNVADEEGPLFHALPPLSCPTADSCAARARELYAKGRQYEALATSDPGNWYRAAVAFAYTAQLSRSSGAPLPELSDASGRVERAAKKAQQLLDDARYQLRRAAAEGDGARTLAALMAVEQLVPEPEHPIRLGIDRIKEELAKKMAEEAK